MAVLTLADLETRVRADIRDEDSSSYAISQAEVYRLINRAYVIVRGTDDTRVKVIPASVTGLTLLTNEYEKTIAASVGVRRVLELWESTPASGTFISAKLERLQPWELRTLEQVTQEQPKYYSVSRAGTATAADVGAWTVTFHDVNNATRYYCIRALVEPTPLSTGTDKPDVDDLSCYAIADIAASVAARINGLEAAYVASIDARIPQAFKPALDRMQAEYLPLQVKP